MGTTTNRDFTSETSKMWELLQRNHVKTIPTYRIHSIFVMISKMAFPIKQEYTFFLKTKTYNHFLIIHL
ncbi:hypothetical protein LEP1GSC008_1852 [Leptospira kirschneri serovar Bulgarica str. Nikolaevo]|uniref:Uncharacterized protein n=1 Tax=Leptospira kirschneri serovar Bulgarica str. Nikolaevo TaxID=1240687 RepID=M6F9A4_9LEPT|nr:hypothetical protein LEP1GSC008_1852 [Leptospira kirschneri serovar Bulgarica str. Nikolaevo]